MLENLLFWIFGLGSHVKRWGGVALFCRRLSTAFYVHTPRTFPPTITKEEWNVSLEFCDIELPSNARALACCVRSRPYISSPLSRPIHQQLPASCSQTTRIQASDHKNPLPAPERNRRLCARAADFQLLETINPQCDAPPSGVVNNENVLLVCVPMWCPCDRFHSTLDCSGVT